jgi:hypothetical protein
LESGKETGSGETERKKGKKLKAGRVGCIRREMKKEKMLIVKPAIELSYVPTLNRLIILIVDCKG